jgi:hypothetical protein
MPVQLVPRQVVSGQQMAHPMWTLVGRPPPAPRSRAATTSQRPLAAGVGLQVERAELVDADHHIRVAIEHVDGAVHQPVQVQDPILLALVVGSREVFQVFRR